MKCVCSNNLNCNRQNKSNTKYFNLYPEFQFLYFISTPSNHLLLRFWFYLRYKNKYVLFDFYFAKFNFLCFISTPSNRSPICVWFYLRYKIRKIIQSSVLSFPGVLKVANFLFPSLSQFFFYCWVETCCPEILHQLCKVPLSISLVVHIVLRSIGEYCESVPLNHTGSYVLSASI